jgi:gliotoxin/aspirochlorine biosynthesis thioredoxin reductase
MPAAIVPQTPVTDVLIIGGSHAGLSAALTLYRVLHTCIIFDSKKPRNSYSTAVRLTSTWENRTPEEMKEASRKELLESGLTTFVDAQVTKIKKTSNGYFEATDDSGAKWVGRKVLLATGTRDIFPDIPGYAELFAQGMYVV